MNHCCDRMTDALKFTCKKCKDPFECPDSILHYTETRAYGLIVHDGGRSFLAIKHCPWCGKKLKKNKTREITRGDRVTGKLGMKEYSVRATKKIEQPIPGDPHHIHRVELALVFDFSTHTTFWLPVEDLEIKDED